MSQFLLLNGSKNFLIEMSGFKTCQRNVPKKYPRIRSYLPGGSKEFFGGFRCKIVDLFSIACGITHLPSLRDAAWQHFLKKHLDLTGQL